ncbi:DUF2167 domain-containing protein [Octadecabacter sp. CECT 8868]|uniref:DUF2167 domain-containing protein n=1 Tax=Octadecabacter algicola TaxID=2909342 RepID=UPI00300C4EF0|nr:DUF2167 domain-containing protein [Octadecabacter algicola]
MPFIKKFLREQIIFLVVSFVSFSSVPAIVSAQEYNPIPFVEPLNVSRGKFIPNGQEAYSFSKAELCAISREEWGWDDCSHVDVYIEYAEGDLGSVMIEFPDSSGYVEYDDWSSEEREIVIREIEESTRLGIAAQSEQLGIPISFTGWSVYPTLDQEKNILYYAIELDWNGDRTINVDASVFDRRGYVTVSMVPYLAEVTEEEIRQMIVGVLGQYESFESQSYASFVSGDKVAAIGSVGVLAALAGIQYGKGTSVGIFAAIALFLKKAWFLLLLPFIWVKKFFSRRKDD